MRPSPPFKLEQARVGRGTPIESTHGAMWGMFQVGPLKVISSGPTIDNPEAAGWEHVSVSNRMRCPTWNEMCKIKDLFWSEDETVIQFHPKASNYKNIHLYCLHLWKKADGEHELPPDLLV